MKTCSSLLVNADFCAFVLKVNMIKDDGEVVHFNNPKVQASLAANTFAVSGHAEIKRQYFNFTLHFKFGHRWWLSWFTCWLQLGMLNKVWKFKLLIIHCESKKTPTQTFYANFGKRWLILTILSLLLSQMNCRRSKSKICYLTLNMLPHYLAKLECSNVQLFIDISQNNRHLR